MAQVERFSNEAGRQTLAEKAGNFVLVSGPRVGVLLGLLILFVENPYVGAGIILGSGGLKTIVDIRRRRSEQSKPPKGY